MKVKLKAGDKHELIFVAEFPNTNDLRERATQTITLQRAIGDIFAGLMANQVPLTMAVSIGEGPPDVVTGDRRINVTIYWRETEDPSMHMFRDLQLAKRCLQCADFMEENHKCKPLQSPEKSEEVEGSDEILL